MSIVQKLVAVLSQNEKRVMEDGSFHKAQAAQKRALASGFLSTHTYSIDPPDTIGRRLHQSLEVTSRSCRADM